jgi:hypothetical protein
MDIIYQLQVMDEGGAILDGMRIIAMEPFRKLRERLGTRQTARRDGARGVCSSQQGAQVVP